MKTFKNTNTILMLIFLLLCGVHNTQAQFWKKLEKRAIKAAEEAVIRKSEEKTREKTEDAIDSIFKVPKKIGRKKKNKNKRDGDTSSERMNDAFPEAEETILSDTYDFEWKYALKMDSPELKKNKEKVGDMKMVFYLNNDSSIFGINIDMKNKGSKMGNTIMIMDPDTGANVMLMEMDGQKIIQQMPSMAFEDIEEAVNEETQKNYTVEKIGTKTILGYPCQGFKIISEEGVALTYIALDAPVSFNNTMSGNTKFKPKGFDPRWLKEFENGLMMEMEYTSNKKDKHNMKMTCVALEKTPISINLGEYKSFMQMGQD